MALLPNNSNDEKILVKYNTPRPWKIVQWKKNGYMKQLLEN